MVLDTYTILVFTAMHSAGIGVILLAAARIFTGEIRDSITAWGSGSLLTAIAWSLLGLRGMIPDLVSIVFANYLATVAIGEYHQAFRIFDREKPLRWPYQVVGLLVAANHTIFGIFSDNMLERSIVSSVVTTGALFCIGLRLVRNCETKQTALRRAIGIGYFFLAFAFVFRAVMLIGRGQTDFSLFENEFVTVFTFAIASVGMVLVALTFLLMCGQRKSEELEVLAVTDSLTGLMNRRAFEQAADREISRSIRHKQSLAYMMVDVKDFKNVNDTYGHKAGDVALQRIATTLKSNLRDHDLLGRLGGDEFGVMLPNTSEEAAYRLMERLKKIVGDETIECYGKSFSVELDIGVSVLATDQSSLEYLSHQADMALYEAKRQAV